MKNRSIIDAIRPSQYSNRRLFGIFLIVMITLLVDLSISQIADIISKESITPTGITTFVSIAVVFSIGQYFMLEMVKARNKMVKVKPPKIHALEQLVTCVQYILIGIIFLVVSRFFSSLITILTCSQLLLP